MTTSVTIPYKLTACLIALFIFITGTLRAQGFLQQKIIQIAKLEAYLIELKKGYDIVQKGLTTIGDIKKGDLDLHTLFFNSLELVNPAVKNYVKIADVIAMQIQMVSDYHSYSAKFTSSLAFNNQELNYYKSVYDNIISLTGKDIDALTAVLSDGKLKMSDDERINRINTLYRQVLDKYNFIHSFGNQAQLHAMQRNQTAQEITNLQKIF